MDSSLAFMITGVALYAGAVAFLVLRKQLDTMRSVLAGLFTIVAVAGSFQLMISLAGVTLWAMYATIALFTATVTYLAFVRDLDRTWTVASTIGAAALVTLASVVVSYLAVMAYIGAVGVYLVLRMWVRVRPALIMMGTALGGFLALSVAAFAVALASM
jgi:hypothetical protein